MKLRHSKVIIFLVCFAIFTGCNKKEHLNESPVPNLQVPETLKDLQSLLDNYIVLNEAPGMGDASSDNYYLLYSSWMILNAKDQNTYLWAKDIFMGIGGVPDWNGPYEQAFYCNVVLKGLHKIERDVTNEIEWNTIKGTALFLRGFAFYNLAQLFTLPYDSLSSGTELGLPLRLSDNVLERSVRSSVQQTYHQIISDVTEATNLLPVDIDVAHPNRPARPAALALLAKVYLSMRMYDSAGVYADNCLKLYDKLLDYNTVDPGASFPFKIYNPEILFFSQVSKINMLRALVSRGTYIDSGLFRSYDSNDLRRSLFYTIGNDGFPIIRSSYTGNIYPFAGIALDEIYLIRAECLARGGNIAAALDDLNTLLANRWKINTFVPFTAITAPGALELVLRERRKELPFRNTRWTDLRRLNKEGGEITLTRKINGQQYKLPPNHLRYALPIPPDVIALSGMPQNPR